MKILRLNELKYSDFLLDKMVKGPLTTKEKEWLKNLANRQVSDFHMEEIDEDKPEFGYDKLGHLTVDGKPIAEYEKEQEQEKRRSEIGMGGKKQRNTPQVMIMRTFGDQTLNYYVWIHKTNEIIIYKTPTTRNYGSFFKIKNEYKTMNSEQFFKSVMDDYDYFIELTKKDAQRFVQFIGLLKFGDKKIDKEKIEKEYEYFNNIV